MIRLAILTFLAGLFLWVPWMDRHNAEYYAEYILAAYGAMPAVCYDSDNAVVHEGVAVRWYPMGRLVHTCTGDYVVWFWGDVKELGGVAKKAEDIEAIHSKVLSCKEVLARQDNRKATSTDAQLTYYEGEYAREPDFSIFPEAEEHRQVIRQALGKGANFAGRFAVAEWSCGTTCQNHAIVDVETGMVTAYGPQTEYGVSYATNTTFLITNPIEHMPALSENPYEMETQALSIARLPREYYRLTHDVLSDTRYLVRECIESSAAGYIEVEDDRIGIVTDEE